nr:zinc finger, CCHC-type [Tanacetum cinerariifolium]
MGGSYYPIPCSILFTEKDLPHHGLDLWLQIQIFYDHVDGTTQKGIDYAAGGRLRKLRPDKVWAAIERLAQYKDKGWNDAFIPDEVSLNYENPDIEQLLGIMERKVDTLMKDAISLMGKSESVFRLTTNEMYQPPSEPSRQEEFEHIVMNFIFDQKERVRQLKDYMRVIAKEFIEFSLEVTRRLKERIKENENKPRKIEKITKYSDTKVLENNAKYSCKSPMLKICQNTTLESISALEKRPIHPRDVIDWDFLANQGLAHSFLNSINTDLFSGPQWMNLFQIIEPVYRELVREFFSLFEFDSSPCRDKETLSGLSRAEMVKANLMLLEFWPNIGDEGFNVGNTKEAVIKEEDEGDDEGNEATGGYAGHEGVRGSADIYRKVIGRFGRRDGWTNKTTNGSVETALRFTCDAVTTTPVTTSGYP